MKNLFIQKLEITKNIPYDFIRENSDKLFGLQELKLKHIEFMDADFKELKQFVKTSKIEAVDLKNCKFLREFESLELESEIHVTDCNGMSFNSFLEQNRERIT